MNTDSTITEVISDTIVGPETVATVMPQTGMPLSEVAMNHSWIETIRGYLKDYPAWAVDIGLFGFGSLLIGFLCKAFGRFVICGLVAGALAIAALHYLDFVQLNTQNLKAFFGFASAYSIHDVVMITIEWIKANTIAFVSIIVGFLIGWKLG